MSDAAARWAEYLGTWAIPEQLLRASPASPWALTREVFVRRADSPDPASPSTRRAREALAEPGAVLDIGAGAGAASLPLLDRATALVAVDRDEPLLQALRDRAVAWGVEPRIINGWWPEVGPDAPRCDVVVCHHVLYNVPDLPPFIHALSAHARRRVVIEITGRHPQSPLNPLWKRFHGITRPTRPTWEDAVAVLAECGIATQVERRAAPPEVPMGTFDQHLETTRRRLCLGPERDDELRAALSELGEVPDQPASWMGAGRELVTLWWDSVPAD